MHYTQDSLCSRLYIPTEKKVRSLLKIDSVLKPGLLLVNKHLVTYGAPFFVFI